MIVGKIEQLTKARQGTEPKTYADTRANPWISCLDKLPEFRERVLARTKHGATQVAYYTMTAKTAAHWLVNGANYKINFVTHWCPIPEFEE